MFMFTLKLCDIGHFEGILQTTEVRPMIYFTIVAQTICVICNGVHRTHHAPLEPLVVVGVLHVNDTLAL